MMTDVEKVKAIQKILGVETDGIIGPVTRAAFDALDDGVFREDWNDAKASSFADPDDVSAYNKCIKSGKTKAQCLKVGDNGIGYWGDDTTTDEPACALNKKHIVEQWGSMASGEHKPVDVQIKDQVVRCILKDTGAPVSRVDLNPGAVAAFGLKPPILVPAKWRWA
jgi:lysozyme family protein